MARLFTIEGYSVLETNQVAAVKTGQIKAQYPLESAINTAGAQNGQVYVVDEKTKTVKYATAAADYVYLHASEEQIYEPHLGRASFVLKKATADKAVPKMLKLTKGDVFETNAVDKGAYADLTAVTAAITAKTISAVANTNGDIKLLATASLTTEPVVFIPVEVVKLPNGTQGIRFVVDKA